MSYENTQFDPGTSPRDEALHDDGRAPLAIAAGLAAALAAGGIWAALVFLTNMEIGYVAWGVGVLVGFAMSRVTASRTPQLAYAAAGLAMVGLFAGKAFIFAGSPGVIARELENDDEAMHGSVAWQMYDARELDQATLQAVDAVEAAGDTLSDALWGQMIAQADAKLGTMTPAQRHDHAVAASKQYVQSMGLVGGIRAQLSVFDLLWLFLAVGTAFRLMAPAKHTASEVEPASV